MGRHKISIHERKNKKCNKTGSVQGSLTKDDLDFESNLSLWCDELGRSSSGKAQASARALRREAAWAAQDLKRKHQCLGCGMWGKGDGGGQKGIPSQDQGHGGVGILISVPQEAIQGCEQGNGTCGLGCERSFLLL